MLTEFQETKLRIFFDLLDHDRNGFVEKDDFLSIGENLRMILMLKEKDNEHLRIIKICQKAWEDIYAYVDQNRDQRASIHEWLMYANERIVNCRKLEYDNSVNMVVDYIFNLFDRNHDNSISIQEYLNLFMTFRLEARHSAKAFIRLDRNEDNLISKEEFYTGTEEFFRSNNPKARGNWLFGPWEEYVMKQDKITVV